MMTKMGFKLKFLMFLHKYFKIKAETICEKANISRATFYRYKKKLKDNIVVQKR
jgi:ACT domain-containing protein